jgi:RecB family exonuclease
LRLWTLPLPLFTELPRELAFSGTPQYFANFPYRGGGIVDTMVKIRRPAQLRLQLFGGGMGEDIYQQLKELEEQHVRAVRGLEKLAKALEHVREAKAELSDLSEEANLNPTLSDLPEQLKVLKDALEEETWRTRGYITDVELEQGYLRRRLQEQERPS